MVSEAVVEEVRARADLVEICGEHMTLKRVGKSHRGPCPLHGGDGPNFSVDAERGIFKCFVCGEGGDVFSFVMKHLGLEFPEAVRYVAARAGVEVPDREASREDPWAHLREAAGFAAEWFAERLREEEGARARGYLTERGVPPEAAEAWGLGWAPDAWRALRDAARERGVPEEDLLELGLLATSERAEEPYDRFRSRLIFTIQDLRDRPIAFGGRALGAADREVPKYINSPDSPIFHKGRTLYGLNRARHAIRREERAAVVEGYTDVLALHLHDLPVAVASLGTAFTQEQAALLARYTRKAHLLYDSDAAGLRATFKTGDVLLAAGVHPLVVTLPPDEDPDSLVRRAGPEALVRCLEDAVDLLERKLQILERKGYLETVEGRRRAVDGLLSTLRSVADPALRDIYLDRAAERTGVRRETLVREVAREGGSGRRPARRPSRGRPAAATSPPAERGGAGPRSAEQNLLLLVLRDPTLAERARREGVTPAHVRDRDLRTLYRRLLRAAEEPGEASWSRGLEGEPRRLAEELLEDATELTHPERIFRDAVRRLVHRPHLERLRAIDRELELAEEAQARELLAEKQRLAERLREAGFPLSFLQREQAREAEKGREPVTGPHG